MPAFGYSAGGTQQLDDICAASREESRAKFSDISI